MTESGFNFIATVNCCEDCAEDFFLKVNQAFVDEMNHLKGSKWDNEKLTKYVEEEVLPNKNWLTKFENFKQGKNTMIFR